MTTPSAFGAFRRRFLQGARVYTRPHRLVQSPPLAAGSGCRLTSKWSTACRCPDETTHRADAGLGMVQRAVSGASLRVGHEEGVRVSVDRGFAEAALSRATVDRGEAKAPLGLTKSALGRAKRAFRTVGAPFGGENAAVGSTGTPLGSGEDTLSTAGGAVASSIDAVIEQKEP
jgi:hypothetical protein